MKIPRWLIITTIVLSVSLLIGYWYLVVYVYANFPHDNPGTVGDTLGGILSPVIGLVGSVLVFLTFYAQRLQLLDQVGFNRFQRSLTYYQEFTSMLDRIKKLTDDFFYPIQGAESATRETALVGAIFEGRPAIRRFLSDLYQQRPVHLRAVENDLLADLINQYRELVYLIRFIDGAALTKTHRTFLQKQISDTLSEMMQLSNPVFLEIRFIFFDRWALDQKEDSHAFKTIHNKHVIELRRAIQLYKDHDSVMRELIELDFISRQEFTRIDTLQYFDKMQFQPSDVQQLDLTHYHYEIVEKKVLPRPSSSN